MSEVYLKDQNLIAWLADQRKQAVKMYADHKDKYNVDGGTEDPNDDVHGSLNVSGTNMRHGPRTLKQYGVDYILFVAGWLYSRGSYAAANSMLLWNKERPYPAPVEEE